jgi:hypothetical protein
VKFAQGLAVGQEVFRGGFAGLLPDLVTLALGEVAGTILADIDVFKHLRFEAVVNGALLVKLTRGHPLIPFSKFYRKYSMAFTKILLV